LTSFFKTNYLHVYDNSSATVLLLQRMHVHVRGRIQGVQRLLMSYEKRSGKKLLFEKQRYGLARRVETGSEEKSLLRSSAMSCCALFRLLPRLLMRRNGVFA